MFAPSARQRQYIITPMQDPRAEYKVLKLFRQLSDKRRDVKVRPPSSRLARASWVNQNSLPLQKVVEGIGTVVSVRDPVTQALVRNVETLEQIFVVDEERLAAANNAAKAASSNNNKSENDGDGDDDRQPATQPQFFKKVLVRNVKTYVSAAPPNSSSSRFDLDSSSEPNGNNRLLNLALSRRGIPLSFQPFRSPNKSRGARPHSASAAFQLASSSPLPLKSFTADASNALTRPSSVSRLRVSEIPLPDYRKSVNRIAVPSNFLKLPNSGHLSKSAVSELFPLRAIYQPLPRTMSSSSRSSKTVPRPSPYFVEAVLPAERLKKKLVPSKKRPASAPSCVSPSVRLARDRLSTPSRFRPLSAGGVDDDGRRSSPASPTEPQTSSPNEKKYAAQDTKKFRRLLLLPGDPSPDYVSVPHAVSLEELTYAVQSNDPRYVTDVRQLPTLSGPYCPVPPVCLPTIGPSRFKPRVQLPALETLGPRRGEYELLRFAMRAAPKWLWREESVTGYGATGDGGVVSFTLKRDGKDNENIENVKEQVREGLRAKGAIEQCGFEETRVGREY